MGSRSAPAQDILDVERLSTEEARGVHAAADIGLDLSAGNTQLLQLGANLSTGLRTPRHWLRLVGGMDFLREMDRGEDLVDARYAHVRYNLLLERRLLLGSGLRVRILGSDRGRLDLATGLMFEEERLDEAELDPSEDALERRVRMANLASFVHPLHGGAEITNVLYFQPAVADPGDFRLLDNLSLRAPLGGAVSLQLGVEWRMDSEPPAGLDEHDLGVETGLAVEVP